MSGDKLIGTVWHWQVGWLRRPELDNEDGYCYEEPDGDLVYTGFRLHRKVARLNIWEEPDGDRYTTLSKAPLPASEYRMALRLHLR